MTVLSGGYGPVRARQDTCEATDTSLLIKPDNAVLYRQRPGYAALDAQRLGAMTAIDREMHRAAVLHTNHRKYFTASESIGHIGFISLRERAVVFA
jgi:hypothetical protein